ncbi:MAG: hypothetical protein H6739_27800 [Alphaproteobacteria bacterium]|nr:hypothetical protein [Alphaproteobacteria bacterium]
MAKLPPAQARQLQGVVDALLARDIDTAHDGLLRQPRAGRKARATVKAVAARRTLPDLWGLPRNVANALLAADLVAAGGWPAVDLNRWLTVNQSVLANPAAFRMDRGADCESDPLRTQADGWNDIAARVHRMTPERRARFFEGLVTSRLGRLGALFAGPGQA